MTGEPKRIYVFFDTDARIERISKYLGITKMQVVEIAVNAYYRKLDNPRGLL